MDFGLDILHYLQDVRLSLPSFVETFFLDLLSVAFYILLPLIMGSIFLWFSGKQKAEVMLFSFIAAMPVNRVLQFIIHQPRPWELDPSIVPSPEAMAAASDPSLPSEQATAVFASYGPFAFMVKNVAVGMGGP